MKILKLALLLFLLFIPFDVVAWEYIDGASQTGGAGGSGDVVGPGSATDGNTTCFDGVTGKLLKECPNTGAVNLYLQDGNGAAPTADGLIKYDRTTERLQVGDGAATTEFYGGAHTVNPITSAAVIPDNSLVVGNGGARDVQGVTNWTLDPADDILHAPDSFRFYNASTSFFHNYVDPTGGGAVPDGYNIFLGEGAGNFTLGSTATNTDHGSYNIGIGHAVLDAVTTGYGNFVAGDNAGGILTTGYDNVVIGRFAGDAITTGKNNIALGLNASGATITASYNIAIGSGAFDASSSSSEYNIAIGSSALGNITNAASDSNVAVGEGAANWASGPIALTNAINSVFLGANTAASAVGNTNEIVIGKSAVGHGSDTSTIGGANMASHYLFSDLDLATGNEQSLTIYGEVDKATSGDVRGIYGSWKDTASPDNFYLLDLGVNSATDGAIGTHTPKHQVDVDGNVWAAGNSTEFGDMFINGTDALTINQANQLHAMDGFSTGEVYGVTFDAGGVGSGNITTSGGGAAINIADVGHGLVSGDYVTVTSANHEGASVVTYVDDDNFTLAIAYVGDEACQWQQGSSLTVSDAGKYMVNFSLSGAGAAATKDFYWAVYKDATLLNNLQVIRSTSTSYGSMSISGIVSLAADDVIYITMENRTDANNWSTEYADLSLSKL